MICNGISVNLPSAGELTSWWSVRLRLNEQKLIKLIFILIY
jgi:hypothetical protein